MKPSSLINRLEKACSEKMFEVFNSLNENLKEDIKNFEGINELAKKIDYDNSLLEASVENLKYQTKILGDTRLFKPYRVFNFDYSSYSLSSSGDTPSAFVDNKFKFITCGYKSRTTHENFDVSILPLSNGLPGNTHEAERIGNNIVFKGESAPNVNLSNLKQDGKVFEYEAFFLPNETKSKMQGLGLTYLEGVSWSIGRDSLKLNLRVSFDSPRYCNMFMLSPFVLNTVGYAYPKIKKIKLYDEQDEVFLLEDSSIKGKELKHTMTYVFKDRKVSYVDIELVQDKRYITSIGHYFIEHNGIRFGIEKETLETLGFNFDKSQNKLHPPTSKRSVDNEELKATLFKKPYEVELLDSERYLIGLSNISLYNCAFEPKSDIISKRLDVNDLQKFQIDMTKNKGDIKVFVSFNLTERWMELDLSDPDRVFHVSDFTSSKVNVMKYKLEFSTNQTNFPILYDFIVKVEEGKR